MVNRYSVERNVNKFRSMYHVYYDGFLCLSAPSLKKSRLSHAKPGKPVVKNCANWWPSTLQYEGTYAQNNSLELVGPVDYSE